MRCEQYDEIAGANGSRAHTGCVIGWHVDLILPRSRRALSGGRSFSFSRLSSRAAKMYHVGVIGGAEAPAKRLGDRPFVVNAREAGGVQPLAAPSRSGTEACGLVS